MYNNQFFIFGGVFVACWSASGPWMAPHPQDCNIHSTSVGSPREDQNGDSEAEDVTRWVIRAAFDLCCEQWQGPHALSDFERYQRISNEKHYESHLVSQPPPETENFTNMRVVI